MTPDATRQHYRSQQALVVAVLSLIRAAWRGMTPDFDSSWAVVGPRVRLVVLSAQLGAARAGGTYLDSVLAELGIPGEAAARLDPRGFVGVAGDGRPVDSLLFGAVTTAKSARENASVEDSLAQGGRWLEMAAQSVVADTGRAAVSAGMTARPAVTGWVRMLQLPSCGRCAVQAGKFFRWNEGFLRHPRCDCRHIPATEDLAGDLTTDPHRAYESGQVRGLTEAQRKAVDEGADFGRVVNSRRGMASARARTTTEAANRVRLTPEGVYAITGEDRDEAIRLLQANGYLTS